MTGRPNRVTLDPAAFAHNLALVRGLLPPGTRIWQVVKGDGYGLGVTRAADLGWQAGLRAFCAGTPDEALALRASHPAARVLLFPSAAASDLPDLARQGITVTAHDATSLDTLLRRTDNAGFLIKVDTGLHRYGFAPEDWPVALADLRASGHSGLQGIYTHFSQSRVAAGTDGPLVLFERFLTRAHQILGHRPPAMAAASPALLAGSALTYPMVDPGRALYGMLPPDQAGGHVLRPVVSAITSRLLDCRNISPGDSIGYGPAAGAVSRIGAFPIGHFDGLPASGPLGTVLIRGAEAPVLARTLLASLVDLSAIPAAQTGDEVVLAGRSGDRHRDLFQLAQTLETSATMLHFGLVRALPKQG
ncbi:alanine racemase [Gemmobacter sp.]|uniref:alanine racemase n=1 Tax=Gemmobacter sp. TaxID=1898957 RepID=UPI002AFF299E|nr:alanine racemase [Gemmobacter sp.]